MPCGATTAHQNWGCLSFSLTGVVSTLGFTGTGTFPELGPGVGAAGFSETAMLAVGVGFAATPVLAAGAGSSRSPALVVWLVKEAPVFVSPVPGVALDGVSAGAGTAVVWAAGSGGSTAASEVAAEITA